MEWLGREVAGELLMSGLSLSRYIFFRAYLNWRCAECLGVCLIAGFVAVVCEAVSSVELTHDLIISRRIHEVVESSVRHVFHH